MKKLLAILGVGVLSASVLVGCGGSDTEKYLGTWTGVATITEEIPEMGELAVDVDLALAVNEDETFVLEATVSSESLEEVKTFVSDAILAQVTTASQDSGVSVEEMQAQMEAQMGMSLDEYVSTQIDPLVETMAPEALEGAWVIESDALILDKDGVNQTAFNWDGDVLVTEDETLGTVEFSKE